MEHKLECHMFGTPEIILNGEKVLFAYGKMNALFYYLLINQTVSRDEIAGLLWPNKNDAYAKKI